MLAATLPRPDQQARARGRSRNCQREAHGQRPHQDCPVRIAHKKRGPMGRLFVALRRHSNALYCTAIKYYCAKISGKTAYCIIDSVRASQQNENWRNAFYTDAAPFCILGHPAEIATHASILPWLGQVLPGKAVHKFLSAQAGESIGLLLYADSDLARIARVFLPLRYACLPDGGTAWFRFYDPRVFTAFFP